MVREMERCETDFGDKINSSSNELDTERKGKDDSRYIEVSHQGD